MGWTLQVSALPGVSFLPPPQPLAPRPSPDNDGDSVEAMAAAADAATTEMQQNPGCLGPVHLTVAALQMAEAAAPEGAGVAALPAALAWPALLDLAAAAAATASERREQQQLLLLLLHGRASWLQRLRQALDADERLQQRWRRELVSVSNRLASDPSGGRGAPAVVHGEERRRRSAAAVTALLPLALLCPEAALERLVTEAVVQAGEQVRP